MDNPIHIAFCVNDGYVPYMLVAITSIIDNNLSNEINIHILTDYISPQMQARIGAVIAGSPNVSYRIYTVKDERLKGLFLNHWAIYTWYRVLLPEILPISIHRVLYLDADTLVLGNLQALFNIDMEGESVAGTTDVYIDGKCDRLKYPKDKGYICAGVLMMNLDYWRDNNLTEGLLSWAKGHNAILRMPDQDTINVICQDTKVILPLKYGIQKCFFIDEQYYHNPKLARELKDCIEQPVIIHFAGSAPWYKEIAYHPFQKDWEDYNNKVVPTIKMKYMTKGWARIKMHIWYAFHPHKKEAVISKSEILQRLTDNVV